MRHIDLLGAALKDDFLCDLLETYDTDVVYDYDRTHEGMPDEYRAEIPDLGLQFIFDENQTLKTLFIRLVEITTFCPLESLEESFPVYASKESAQQHATELGFATTQGQAEFMGEVRDWIRFEQPEYSVHYEFRGSGLALITLQAESV